MKKLVITFICPFQHFSVSFRIAESDDFIKLFILDGFFYPFYFFFAGAVFGFEFSGIDTAFESGFCCDEMHPKMRCKWLNPNIQRSRNDVAFRIFPVNILDKFQCIFSNYFRVILIKKQLGFLLDFFLAFAFEHGTDKTFLYSFGVGNF